MDEIKNQGEGDRASARRYDRNAERFVKDGNVEPAAKSAEQFVEQHPAEASRDERKAKRGPSGLPTLDELIAKGRQLVARLRERFADHSRK
jgi:hypothetical protein